MHDIDITLAERGQIVIPKAARDALGLKPGALLRLRVEGGRLLIEKRVQLDLSRWIGKALPDGLSTEQALAELRGRPVQAIKDETGTNQFGEPTGGRRILRPVPASPRGPATPKHGLRLVRNDDEAG